MRFKLPALFFATAAAACLVVWAIAAGWLSGDFEERNLAIMQKLEQPANITTAGWTVADLASYLQVKHKIPVLVKPCDASKELDDRNLSKIRLKNSIRLVLLSSELSFAVRNGKLEILDKKHPAAFVARDVYSQGDLVIPHSAK